MANKWEISPQLPLLEKSRRSGWLYPTKEAPPGIFIEEARKNECGTLLTENELHNAVIPLWKEIRETGGWTKTGFEVAQAFEHISIRCDCFDFFIVHDIHTWRLGEEAPPGYRKWAIEFPDEQKRYFIRRLFWCPTKKTVLDLDERGRCIKKG